MSMSKKDFIAMADSIREIKPRPTDPTWDYGEALLQWESFRDAMARFCQSQNGQFKRDRWLSYIAGECGPNGGAVKSK